MMATKEHIVMVNRITLEATKQELNEELKKDMINFENVDYLVDKLKRVQQTVVNFSR